MAFSVAGLVAQFLTSPWVAAGVAQAVLAILVLDAAGGTAASRQKRIAVAAKLVLAGSLVGVALQATQSTPLRLGIVVVGLWPTFGLRAFPAPAGS